MSTPGRNDRRGLKIVALSAGTMLSAAMVGGSVMHLSSASAAAKSSDTTTQAQTFRSHHRDKGDEETHVRKSERENKNVRKSESNNSNNSSSGSNSSSLIELNNVLNNSLTGLSLHVLGL